MEKQLVQILFFDTQRGWVKDTLEVKEINSLRVEQNARDRAEIREVKV